MVAAIASIVSPRAGIARRVGPAQPSAIGAGRLDFEPTWPRAEIAVRLWESGLGAGRESVARGAWIPPKRSSATCICRDLFSNYIEAFLQNVNWDEVNVRFEHAQKVLALMKA